MPMTLAGSCRCGAVAFTVESHTPVPYQRCYCSICRKTAGGGGYAVNLGGIAASLSVRGRGHIGVYRAEIQRGETCEVSTGERNFCVRCATALWLHDIKWPDLIPPFASAIDTPLPVAPSHVHLMLKEKPDWVPLDPGPHDECYDAYPELSLDDWHRKHGLRAA